MHFQVHTFKTGDPNLGVINLKGSSQAQGSSEIIYGNARNESDTEPS